jgi:HrpA-like RNA helicase
MSSIIEYAIYTSKAITDLTNTLRLGVTNPLQLSKLYDVVNGSNSNSRNIKGGGKQLESKIVSADEVLRPIGILDPEGKSVNPFTKQPYSENYKKLAFWSKYKKGKKGWAELPIYPRANEFIKAIRDNDIIMFTSVTGSGKTVLMPKFALHIFADYQAKVVCTSPKQLTAASSAKHNAELMDVPIGTYVGYKYKGKEMIDLNGVTTHLMFVTDGLLVAQQKSDPLFTEYDVIILDEAHERNVRIDLILKLVKDAVFLRKSTTKPLKFIIMSATIDTKQFENYFPKSDFKYFWIDNSSGPLSFPITEHFSDVQINKFNAEGISEGSADKTYIKGLVDILTNKVLQLDLTKHIIAFVPATGDADKTCKIIAPIKDTLKIKPYCIGLNKDTKPDVQELITQNSNTFKKENRTADVKLIISTNVAESSVTVENLEVVIDTGLALIERFYPKTGINALEKRYVAKSNHSQRKGRTGRTMPGMCFNLFTEDEYKRLFPDFADPPIIKEEMTDDIFSFIANNNISYVEFPFVYPSASSVMTGDNKITLGTFLGQLITPPPVENVQYTIDKLISIDALVVVEGKAVLTEIGQAMAKFHGIPPTFARMILAANDFHCRMQICAIVAMMIATSNNINSIMIKPASMKQWDSSKKTPQERESERRYRDAIKKFGVYNSDHLTLLNIFSHFNAEMDKYKMTTAPVIGVRGVVEEIPPQVKKWCFDNKLSDRTLKEARYFLFIKSAMLKKLDELTLQRQIKYGNDPAHYLFGQKHFYLFPKENNIASIVSEASLKQLYGSASGAFAGASQIKNHYITMALIFGSVSNIAVRNDKEFKTTYPLQVVSAKIDSDSFVDINKTSASSACIYNIISGRPKPIGNALGIVSPISAADIALLPKHIQELMMSR